MENFGSRLKKLRKEKRRTQEDVAKIVSVKRATYSGYERGVIMPPYQKLDALAKYFDVSVDYLVGDSGEGKTVPDVSETLSELLGNLKDGNSPVVIDGVEIDEDSRELLISSLENSVKLSKHIIKNRGKKT